MWEGTMAFIGGESAEEPLCLPAGHSRCAENRVLSGLATGTALRHSPQCHMPPKQTRSSEAVQAVSQRLFSRTFEDQGYPSLLDAIPVALCEEAPSDDEAINKSRDAWSCLVPRDDGEGVTLPDCGRYLDTALQDDHQKVTAIGGFGVVA